MTTVDTSKPFDLKGIRQIQSIIGSFLYYARAIENTMLTALNEIAMKKSKATEKNIKSDHKITKLCCHLP